MAQQTEWISGLHAVESFLINEPDRVIRACIQEGRQDKRLQKLLALLDAHEVPTDVMPRKEIDRLGGQAHRHQGILIEAKGWQIPSESGLYDLLESTGVPFLLILDGVTDVHNLGACLRSAWAAGCTAVILPKDKSAPINATVRKVAVGAVEHLPIFYVTNLARTLSALQERNIWITGLSGAAEQTIWASDFKGAVAIVMGSEDKGIRRLTQENCDFLAKIPMSGSAESLNVSVATGVTLFEALRQRSEAN